MTLAESSTTVAVVDDHYLFGNVLAAALSARGTEVLQPRLTTIEELRDRLLDAAPVVALLDRDLGPVGSGEDLISPLAAAGTAVIVVSGSLDETTAGRCLAYGAAACLSKTEPFETVLGAVLAAAAGEPVLTSAERERLVAAWRRSQADDADAAAPFARLSPREASVLGQLMDGRPVRSIADEACVSEGTVRTQVRAILQKLDVNSQLEAVALATRIGWRPHVPPIQAMSASEG